MNHTLTLKILSLIFFTCIAHALWGASAQQTAITIADRMATSPKTQPLLTTSLVRAVQSCRECSTPRAKTRTLACGHQVQLCKPCFTQKAIVCPECSTKDFSLVVIEENPELTPVVSDNVDTVQQPARTSPSCTLKRACLTLSVLGAFVVLVLTAGPKN